LQTPQASHLRYTFGEVSFDLHAKSVLRAAIPVKLTPTEYRLLARLVQSAGKVVTEQQLMADAMQAEHAGRRDLLRLCMAQLRALLEADPFEPQWLLAVPGVGYQLAGAQSNAP
jgi:two-component system KDP operon response regulator KdpE